METNPITKKPLNLKKPAIAALAGVLLLFTLLFAISHLGSSKLSVAEIAENSAKYQELESLISGYNAQVAQYNALIQDSKRKQAELSHRNELLRELFTEGKNQPQSPTNQVLYPNVALN